MKNIELLAPAGDQESLIAAIQNGADAIYLGGTLFNARASAKNFNNKELKWAVEYAHLRQVKIYVTINTLYRDDEFDELIRYLDYLYDIQVDALIIQDIGLFDVVRARYEDFEIHMSTQASIMNKEAAIYFQELGASRIVLARENTLEEIRHICQSTSLEVEVFVHGALCVCYSGQCLMSSFIGKRSGNRGECAQPCRLQYRLSKNGKVQPEKVNFLLSPKDLMTIDRIGDLIDAGVTSFKVEGRMKKPEYVASVIKAYRKAIDRYLHHQKNTFEEDIYYMKAMFNRDYTKGYIYHDQHIVTGDYSGNKGIVIGNVIGYRKKDRHVIIQLNQPIKQGDSLIFEKIDKGRPINKIFVNNRLVSKAAAHEVAEIEFNYPVYEGNVRKTIDVDIIEHLHHTYDKEYCKLPIEMTFIAHIHQQPQLIINYKDITICKSANIKVEEAIKTPLDCERIRQQLSKLGKSPFVAHEIHIDVDNRISIPIKIINEMRRESIDELTENLSHRQIHLSTPKEIHPTFLKENSSAQNIYVLISDFNQLKIVLKYKNIDMIFYPYQEDSLEAFELCLNNQQDFALFIPRICKDDELQAIKKSPIYQRVENVVVNEYGAYFAFHDKKRIIGTGLNVYNSYAVNHYHDPIILSLEMSQKQINQLNCNHQQCLVQIYGKIENMISEYCPISQYYFGFQKKNCQLCKCAEYTLIDRKNESFELMMDEQCRMHLLNCRTLFIEPSQIINTGGYFIHFTNESSEMVEFILNELFLSLLTQRKSKIKEKVMTTSGYFKI